jgi:hypothetical protein
VKLRLSRGFFMWAIHRLRKHLVRVVLKYPPLTCQERLTTGELGKP